MEKIKLEIKPKRTLTVSCEIKEEGTCGQKRVSFIVDGKTTFTIYQDGEYIVEKRNLEELGFIKFEEWKQ